MSEVTVEINDQITVRAVGEKTPRGKRSIKVTLLDKNKAEEQAFSSPHHIQPDEISKLSNKRSGTFKDLYDTYKAYNEARGALETCTVDEFQAKMREFAVSLNAAIEGSQLEFRQVGGQMTPDSDDDDDDSQVVGAEVEEVPNNHLCETYSLETIPMRRRMPKKSDPDVLETIDSHKFLVYHQDSGDFNLHLEEDELPDYLRNKPAGEYSTVTRPIIDSLLAGNETGVRLSGMPDYANFPEIRKLEFRKSLWKQIRKEFRNFVGLTDEAYYDVCVAYLISSYFYDMQQTVGFLLVHGLKGTGKTQLLDTMSAFGYRATATSHSSTSSLFRTTETVRGMWAFDEAQYLFSESSDADKQAILLGSYQKDHHVTRMVPTIDGWAVRTYDIYCPKVFGTTEYPGDVLADRCIPILMEKPLGNKSYEVPSGDVVPKDNEIRVYLTILRMMFGYQFKAMALTNEYSYLFKNRDKQIVRTLLLVAQFFYPEVLDSLAKTLRRLLDTKKTAGAMGPEHRLLTMLLDEKYLGTFSAESIMGDLNKLIFGKDWKKTAYKAHDVRAVTGLLTKLGFSQVAGSSATRFEITEKDLIESFARQGVDVSDVYGRERVLEHVDEEVLQDCLLSGFGDRKVSQITRGEYTEEEKEFISEEIKETKKAAPIFAKEREKSEEEAEWEEEQRGAAEEEQELDEQFREDDRADWEKEAEYYE